MRLSDNQETNSAIWNALESNVEQTLHQLQDEYDDNAEESFASTEAWLKAELSE